MITQSSAGGAAGSSKVMLLVHGAGHFILTDSQFVQDKVTGFAGHPINFVAAYYTDVPNSPFDEARARAAAFEQEFVHYAVLTALSALPTQTLLGALASGSGLSLLNMLAPMVQPGTPIYNVIAQYGALGATGISQILSGLTALTRNIIGQPAPTPTSGTPASGQMDINCTVWEVMHYFFDQATNQRLRQLVSDALDKALQYDEVVIVSHSLGTVITYDILRQLPAADNNKISHWFTTGCPLAKVVRALPDWRALGNINYDLVGQWYNVYAPQDLVASPIGPVLTAGTNYLIEDIYIDIGTDPVTAHDYLHSDEVLSFIAETMK